MGLLHVPARLGLPLLGGSKLRTHVSSQLGLLDKAIPLRLLLVEELGFYPTASNKDLERRPALRNTKTQKHLKKEENKGERTDTWLVGTTISSRAPLAWSRAFIMVESSMSRLSRSMLSA